MGALVDCVSELKTKFPDCLVFVGGDFNNKNMSNFCDAYADLVPLNAGATLGTSALDEIYSNLDHRVAEKIIFGPLCKDNGTPSDHKIIAAAFRLPKKNKPVTTTFEFRPITVKGREEFKNKLLSTDWSTIHSGCPTTSAELFDGILQEFITSCFPVKKNKIKSTDTAWFNPKIKKLAMRKIRIYRAEGKSEKYKRVSCQCDAEIKKAKTAHFEKIE